MPDYPRLVAALTGSRDHDGSVISEVTGDLSTPRSTTTPRAPPIRKRSTRRSAAAMPERAARRDLRGAAYRGQPALYCADVAGHRHRRRRQGRAKVGMRAPGSWQMFVNVIIYLNRKAPTCARPKASSPEEAFRRQAVARGKTIAGQYDRPGAPAMADRHAGGNDTYLPAISTGCVRRVISEADEQARSSRQQ